MSSRHANKSKAHGPSFCPCRSGRRETPSAPRRPDSHASRRPDSSEEIRPSDEIRANVDVRASGSGDVTGYSAPSIPGDSMRSLPRGSTPDTYGPEKLPAPNPAPRVPVHEPAYHRQREPAYHGQHECNADGDVEVTPDAQHRDRKDAVQDGRLRDRARERAKSVREKIRTGETPSADAKRERIRGRKRKLERKEMREEMRRDNRLRHDSPIPAGDVCDFDAESDGSLPDLEEGQYCCSLTALRAELRASKEKLESLEMQLVVTEEKLKASEMSRECVMACVRHFSAVSNSASAYAQTMRVPGQGLEDGRGTGALGRDPSAVGPGQVPLSGRSESPDLAVHWPSTYVATGYPIRPSFGPGSSTIYGARSSPN